MTKTEKMLAILLATGPDGIRADTLAAGMGATVGSMYSLLKKAKDAGKIATESMRDGADKCIIGLAGVLKPLTDEQAAIIEAVNKAGGDGMPAEFEVPGVTLWQCAYRVEKLVGAGVLFKARKRALAENKRVFSTAEQRDAWDAAFVVRQRETKKLRDRESYARTCGSRPKPVPKPRKPKPKPIVFAKPKPQPKSKRWDDSTPIINNVTPTVIPVRPDTRFKPDPGWRGGCVSAKECRPWARAVAP